MHKVAPELPRFCLFADAGPLRQLLMEAFWEGFSKILSLLSLIVTHFCFLNLISNLDISLLRKAVLVHTSNHTLCTLLFKSLGSLVHYCIKLHYKRFHYECMQISLVVLKKSENT